MPHTDASNAHSIDTTARKDLPEQGRVRSMAHFDGGAHELPLTFSLRSILIGTTFVAVLLGGYVRWHWISFAVLVVAMPVGGFGMALMALGVLWATGRKFIRATAGGMLVFVGGTVIMLSATIVGISLVIFIAELGQWLGL
jgi:hypothetical protein